MDLFSTIYVVLGTVTKDFMTSGFVNIIEVMFGHFSLFGKWLSLLLFSPANLRSRSVPGTAREASLTQPGSFNI